MSKKSKIPNDLAPFANLLESVSENKQVFIFFHNKPDVDTLASAFALQHLLTVYLKRNAVVVGCDNESQSLIPNSRLSSFKKFFNQNRELCKKINPNKPSIAIYVDFAQEERAFSRQKNYVPKNFVERLIIDHHPMSSKTKTSYINTTAAANTELIAFLGLLLTNNKILKDLTFAYLVVKGIISDTNHLQNLNSNNSNTWRLVGDLLEHNQNLDFSAMNKIEELKTREQLLLESRLSSAIFANVKEKSNNLLSCFINEKIISDNKLPACADGIFLMKKISNFDKFVYTYYDTRSKLWVIKVRSANKEQGLLDIIDYFKQDEKMYVGGHEFAAAINFNEKINENEARAIHDSIINFLTQNTKNRNIKLLKTLSQLKDNKSKYQQKNEIKQQEKTTHPTSSNKKTFKI